MLATRARAMRNDPTEPEKRLWRALSRRQFGGFKVRRQTAIGSYIVDFFCPQRALVIEVDGDTHDRARDAARDAALAHRGFRTVRVTNTEVMRNLPGVLEMLLAILQPQRWAGARHHPNTSSEEEGLERSAPLPPSPSGEGLGVGPRV